MINCPVCKQENENEFFCVNCRFPLNVKRLKDFTAADLEIQRDNLLEMMKSSSSIDLDDDYLKQVYHEFFNFNWLRPESALYNYMMVKELTPYKKFLKYPLLDLGCGDGVFTSILFGGQVNPLIDGYGFVNLEQTDIYNNYTGSQKNILIKKPQKIGIGIDIKENSINNAKDLGVYDDLKVGDIRSLPFEKESMASAYSNMIDDIKNKDLHQVFTEVKRVLKKEGYFIFTSPTEFFRESLFYYPKSIELVKSGELEEAQKMIQYDRGRSEWEPRSKEFWENVLSQNSFKMVNYIPFLDETLLKFWDVGFRPLFPDFFSVRKLLQQERKLSIVKPIIVEMMKNYFYKYTEVDLKNRPTFAIIIAQKFEE